MPCPTNAPINLSTSVVQQCSSKCNFEYNYGLASCIVTNKNTYLDISCFSGLNQVKYGGVDLTVSGVRLYLKSLNTYDGFEADAELIITHTAGAGKKIYICIPVVNNEKASDSSKWFSKVIPYSPTENNTGQEISVSNFTLDNVIPESSFYSYDGGTFSWGCNSSDEMIIYHMDQAINMKNREFRTLSSILSRSSMNRQTPKSDQMTFNQTGTSQGAGSSGGSGGKTLTCTPIEDGDGNPLGQSLLDSLIPSDKGSGGFDGDMTKILPWLGVIIGIIIGLVVIFILYKLISFLTAKNVGGGSGGNSSG